MESANHMHTARARTLVSITPSQLRMIADRLDASLENVLPGQEIVCDFTSSVTFVYNPEVNTQRYQLAQLTEVVSDAV